MGRPWFIRVSVLAVAATLVTPGLNAPASAASAWTAAEHSAVRLLDGGDAADLRLGGVEIRLDAGFITYWRSAGDAGVPPVFDFRGSSNVKDLRVDYPAPRLIDEDGTTAYGYAGGVTFPVRITPEDAAAPVRLRLALDYAVCSRLCLPAKARLALTLGPAAKDAAQVKAALATVPSPARLGEAGPIRIDALRWTGDRTITVEAAVPDGAGTLFVEAPDPLYVSVSSGRRDPARPGGLGFTLTGPDHPLPAAGPLRLTLVTPSGSIEVPVTLDAVPGRP